MQNRQQRVYGTSSKTPSTPGNGLYNRNLTPDQKIQRERETQAAYEVWRSEREARKAKRYDTLRSRNIGL